MKDTRVRTYCAYIASVITCALLVLVSLPSPARTALADLPPRPTPQPMPSAPKPNPTGGTLEPHVQFPETLPYQWQELWTEVQWLDEWGRWRDVAGWQGTLDEVQDGVGKKTWWVAKDDLGRGPFRWRVYRSQGGWLLATSQTFDLPSQKRATTSVEVTLAP